MSENCLQCERCIVVTDKSQDSTDKHLSCDGIFQCEFIIQFAYEKIFKIGEHLAKSHAIIVKKLNSLKHLVKRLWLNHTTKIANIKKGAIT